MAKELARNAVLGTVELLETIIVHLPVKDICVRSESADGSAM